MCIYTCMHACLWADLYLCLSLVLHLLLSLSFFLDIYIYIYIFHWPQEGGLEGPNRKVRRVWTGARIQQIYFVGHGARLGLGSAMAVLVSMVEDVVVVAAPVLVLAIPPCGIASSLAAIFVYSTLYSILRK